MTAQTRSDKESNRTSNHLALAVRAVLSAAIMLVVSLDGAPAEEGAGGPSGLATKPLGSDLITVPDPRRTDDPGGPTLCHWSRHRHQGSCAAPADAQVGNRCTCPIKSTSGQTELWIQVDGRVMAAP